MVWALEGGAERVASCGSVVTAEEGEKKKTPRGLTDLRLRLMCSWRAGAARAGGQHLAAAAGSHLGFIDSLISEGASRAVSSTRVEHPAALHSIKAP